MTVAMVGQMVATTLNHAHLTVQTLGMVLLIAITQLTIPIG
jgi:hypothetical protein